MVKFEFDLGALLLVMAGYTLCATDLLSHVPHDDWMLFAGRMVGLCIGWAIGGLLIWSIKKLWSKYAKP